MLKLFQEAAHLCVYIKDQTILIVYYAKASRSIHNKYKIIQRSLTYLLIYLLKQHIKFNKTTHKMQYIIYDEVIDEDDNLPKMSSEIFQDSAFYLRADIGQLH